MHRALAIREILDEIVSYLDDDKDDLRALALTARCFQQPANQNLYRDGNANTLLSFLERMIHVCGDAEQDARTRLRCLDQARLVRSLYLRSRVIGDPISKSLGLEWNEILAGLTLLRRPLYVFPNLQKLDIVSADPEMMMLVDALLCPTIRMLSLYPLINERHQLPAWESRLFGLIGGLPEKACGLSGFEVCLDRSRHRWRAPFGRQLAKVLGQHCRRLSLVEFGTEAIPTTPDLLSSLTHSESLEAIILHPMPNCSGNVARDRLLYRTISGFRSLKKAELREGALILELVQCLIDAPLKALDLEVTTWGPHVATLLDVVCTFASTLTDLYVRESSDLYHLISLEEYSAYALPRQAFTVLGRCSMMQYFRFGFYLAPPEVLDLHNSDIATLANSWPMLRDIQIHYGVALADDVDVPVNLEAFVPLSLYCPDLNSIEIHPLSPTLNVIPLPSLPAHPWKAITVHCPSSFNRDSSDATVAKITHYLDALWPDLYILIEGSYNDFDEKTASIPKVMNTILTGLRTERTMRPGSRWRIDREAEGMHAVPDMLDLGFSRSGWVQSSTELPDACPWEIID